MSGKNFTQHPLDRIVQLQTLLQESYQSGFPVVKELIQNADDARAETVKLIVTDGFPDEENPLLRGRALVVINNGEFSEKDEAAILHFGLNYKAEDGNSVGKFGLGLKSVFHLCEAFFYFYGETLGSKYEIRCFEMLNPWLGPNGDEIHHGWDDYPQSLPDLMAKRLQPFLDERWFVLWLPLRSPEHWAAGTDDECDPILDAECSAWTLEQLLGRDMPRHLASILPFRQVVSSVQGFECAEAGIRPLFEIACPRDSSPKHRQLAHGQRSRISGKLTVTQQGSVQRQGVATGFELMLDDGEVSRLQQERTWPRRPTLAHLRRGVPEKNKPHCGVYFSWLDGQQPHQLSIDWAQFLPLGEAAETISCALGGNVALVLHGDFFVNPGRSRVDGVEDVEEDGPVEENRTKHQWNWHLAHAGTLPQLIPALAIFVEQAHFDESKIRLLTEALRSSFLFRSRRYRDAICRDRQWVYRIREDDAGWESVPATESVFELPRLADENGDLPYRVFPRLSTVSQQVIVTYASLPRLKSTLATTGDSEHVILNLLEVNATEVLSDLAHLEYFTAFLRNLNAKYRTDRVGAKLVAIVREGLVDAEPDILLKHKTSVQDLLREIPPELRIQLGVGCEDAARKNLFQSLQNALNGQLLVPLELEPEEPDQSSGRVDVETAANMLDALSRSSRGVKDESPHVAEFATAVLRRTAGDTNEVLSRSATLPIFVAFDCARNARVAVSFAELQSTHEAGTLYLKSQRNLPAMLQQAVSNIRVLTVEKNHAPVSWKDIRLSGCTVDSCLQLLSLKPRLAAPRLRSGLLTQLISQPRRGAISDNDVRAIRYLLHGTPEHFDDSQPLVFVET